jgi:hypothetical protein
LESFPDNPAMPDESTERGYILAPDNFDIEPHAAKASLIIKNYTTMFMLNGDMLGSGVCLQTCGFFGIATARHVASAVMQCSDFALYVNEGEESEWTRPDAFEHVDIDSPESRAAEAADETGPDLSFLIIRDAGALEVLKRKKPFYPVAEQRSQYWSKPLDGMLWAIAGSPHEQCQAVKYEFEQDGAITKVRNLVVWGGFRSRTVRNGYDYIELTMPCGGDPCPASYQGMSGGGLWAVPLEIDPSWNPSTVAHGSPLLGGIQVYQSEPANGCRVTTGHGFDSVYGRLREVLSRHRAAAA